MCRYQLSLDDPCTAHTLGAFSKLAIASIEWTQPTGSMTHPPWFKLITTNLNNDNIMTIQNPQWPPDNQCGPKFMQDHAYMRSPHAMTDKMAPHTHCGGCVVISGEPLTTVPLPAQNLPDKVKNQAPHERMMHSSQYWQPPNACNDKSNTAPHTHCGGCVVPTAHPSKKTHEHQGEPTQLWDHANKHPHKSGDKIPHEQHPHEHPEDNEGPYTCCGGCMAILRSQTQTCMNPQPQDCQMKTHQARPHNTKPEILLS
ncbi:hypothetical protein BS47DRAFT_1367482 [Hydnum rufescens UP504]|uniref:Uncharacterized protein n=1 Tax=Hydnum rufescens UP504 TaxID=1448309 RepID=A0A9P6AID0_9AGAM|nr:hypothetical protein BS47DRAFT_1367482 [Hydnum rufescens UP504]